MVKARRGQRPKHVPQRTCIACRQATGKRTFVRLVRTDIGVEIDLTSKKPGRGAYLHPIRSCWEIGLKGSRIEQALRTKLTVENRKVLVEFMESLPEAEEPTGAQSQADAAKADRNE